jgi:Na+-transporting methylmalonyl-CoA/oxaloacetate decarboxylase gamma subunit
MTSVDWGQAWQIGGVGFGVVFAILIILAITIWLVGLVLIRNSAGKSETGEKKDGG